MKRRDLIKKLESAGFVFKEHGGNHDTYKRGNDIEQVPRHRELNEITAKKSLRSGGFKSPASPDVDILTMMNGGTHMGGFRNAYPVFIKQDEKDYLVYIPDLEIYTEGKDIPDAIAMARDAIGLKLVDAIEYPEASGPEEALKKAREDADETFDYSDGLLTYVDVDCESYRKKLRNRAVKKNCTIPFWLNKEAEEQGINFSKVLQEALIQKLNIG